VLSPEKMTVLRLLLLFMHVSVQQHQYCLKTGGRRSGFTNWGSSES